MEMFYVKESSNMISPGNFGTKTQEQKQTVKLLEMTE